MLVFIFSSRVSIPANCEVVSSRIPPVSPTLIIDRYNGLKTPSCLAIASEREWPELTAWTTSPSISLIPDLCCCSRINSSPLSIGSPACKAVLNCVVMARISLLLTLPEPSLRYLPRFSRPFRLSSDAELLLLSISSVTKCPFSASAATALRRSAASTVPVTCPPPLSTALYLNLPKTLSYKTKKETRKAIRDGTNAARQFQVSHYHKMPPGAGTCLLIFFRNSLRNPEDLFRSSQPLQHFAYPVVHHAHMVCRGRLDDLLGSRF